MASLNLNTGPAVQGHEPLAREQEDSREHLPLHALHGLLQGPLGITADADHLRRARLDRRPGKDRHVEPDRLLCLGVEPQERRDLLDLYCHDCPSWSPRPGASRPQHSLTKLLAPGRQGKPGCCTPSSSAAGLSLLMSSGGAWSGAQSAEYVSNETLVANESTTRFKNPANQIGALYGMCPDTSTTPPDRDGKMRPRGLGLRSRIADRSVGISRAQGLGPGSNVQLSQVEKLCQPGPLYSAVDTPDSPERPDGPCRLDGPHSLCHRTNIFRRTDTCTFRH